METQDIKAINTWRPAAFGDFQKKHRNACGFAWEFLRSCKYYRPGQSVKRRGKSSSLHLKKCFLVGGCGFLISDVVSGGLLGHFAWPWAPTSRW